MKNIIYILLFLLVVSIANNYILHYHNKQNQIIEDDKKYLVNPTKIPDNIGIMSLYIFYNKDDKYGKCHESDQLDNSDSSDKSSMDVNIKKIITEIYNKNNNKCYVIKKNSNTTADLNKYLDKAIKRIT